MAKESTTTVAAGNKIIKGKDGLVYKPEENKLVVTGKLTAFRHSTTKYKADKEVYQVSILTHDLTMDVINDIKSRYFSETKEKYLPSFIKKAESDGPEELYINLSSQYEFGTFIDGEGNKRYSYDEVIDLGEGLAPIHSEVKLSMRLKEDGIYPLALLIVSLKKQDAADFFE